MKIAFKEYIDDLNTIGIEQVGFLQSLQRAQNALARVVPSRPPGSSSLHLLIQLHWLRVEWCIKF